MSRKEYIFDKLEVNARNISRSTWSVVRSVLRVMLVSLAIALLLYFIVSLFVSTDMEKKLAKENRQYEELYSSLRDRQKLISRSISVLQQKDHSIYKEVFDSEAPSVDPVSSLDFLFGADSIPDGRLVAYTADKSEALLSAADDVNASFLKIYRILAGKKGPLPPMEMPVENASYPQIGAGMGKHYNPFYRADVEHTGLDIIASQGTPVRAAAAGVVATVDRSNKGNGNVVQIDHGNGYMTRYEHLTEMYVSSGQRVSAGTKIGTVGMTGVSFATHLHYEVLKDGTPVNPVDHFFAAIGPDEYSNMLYMSLNTRQSMD